MKFLLLFLLLPLLTAAQDRPVGRAFATRSEVMARNGIACTSHPLPPQRHSIYCERAAPQ